MSAETFIPEVVWAQRSNKVDAAKNSIYLTINVPDVAPADLKLDIQPTTITFTGVSSTLKKTYHVELPLYAEIDPAASATHHTAKSVEMKLQKKELKEEYWPRLLKDSKKMHFLKTDFDKWVDEDEQDEAPEDDFSQFGGGMGGMPGMGMGGMGGMGGGDFGGIDFSKLGGGDMGMGAPEEEEDDDDDDDMPALEGEEGDEPKKEEEPAAEAKESAAPEETKA